MAHNRRNPAFSAIIVLLLVFGIGANTLIFTAVDVLLQTTRGLFD